MNIAILGCGNWGSVFGIMQHGNGHAVRIWEYDRKRCERVRATRNNEPFLKGHLLPGEIDVHWDIGRVTDGADLIVSAIPAQVLRTVVESMKKCDLHSTYYLSLTKGIEIETLCRPSEIMEGAKQAQGRIYVLSGPCIANEIVRKEPTAVVIVGPDPGGARELQTALSTEYFRIYQSDDAVGVELGAAIKNVIAIGCGISDGLGFGANAKGALITRAIVEMQRIGVCMGAKERTFWGLSGFGDLVTTAFSEESRNHILGKKVGQGMSLAQASAEMIMVAEGAATAVAVHELAKRHGIEMPICEVVYGILHRNESPAAVLSNLMRRPLKCE